MKLEFTSHVSVNLNEEEVVRAMILLAEMPKALRKVTSAHIHAHAFYLGHAAATPTFLQAENILRVFQAIGNLPHLKTLTVDLHHIAALPVEALVMALLGNNRLKSLHFSRLQFTGTLEELDLLRLVLKEQRSLRSIELKACRGNPLILESLLVDPPALSRVAIDGAGMMGRGDVSCVTATNAWAKLLRSSPRLESLSLVSLPAGQISDNHILALAKELSSGKRTNLKELTVVSSLLGEESGKAISTMMRFNDTIEHLTLHIDWEHYGHSVAKMLATNYTLQSFDFRAYGDEDAIAYNVVKLAKALKSKTPGHPQARPSPPSALKKLRLCFEIDPSCIPEEVLDTFSEALETNETLEKLNLTDGIETCLLPTPMRTRMRLNRLGMHHLLRSSTSSCDTPVNAVHNAFVEAIIRGKNDTDVVFEMLSNYPVLCIAALQEHQEGTSPMSSSPSSSVQLPCKHCLTNNDDSATTSSSASPTFAAKKSHHHNHGYHIRHPGKSIGRRVMSLFNPVAPSA